MKAGTYQIKARKNRCQQSLNNLEVSFKIRTNLKVKAF